MTDPTPALVDTIAAALYDHRKSTADTADDTIDGWPEWSDLPESWRDFWQDAARAALAAMALAEIPALPTEVRQLRAAIAAVDAIERWPYNPGTMQGFELDQAQGYNDALAEVHRALHPEGEPGMTRQPFENAVQQPDTAKPTRECPPATIAPQTGPQGRKGVDPPEVADRKRFGANVRTRRVALGLTQTELAERMAMAGMDEWRQHITSRVERGSRGVTQDEVLALEDILDVNLCTSDDWETVGVPALMAEVRRLRSESNDRYADGYAAARRYYGDTAPIALDKIRAEMARWDDMSSDQFAAVEHLAEIAAILDTAKEPHHD